MPQSIGTFPAILSLASQMGDSSNLPLPTWQRLILFTFYLMFCQCWSFKPLLFELWINFYTARIVLLLCICCPTHMWHILHGAYAVYTPWGIYSVTGDGPYVTFSSCALVFVWCINSGVCVTHAPWGIYVVCIYTGHIINSSYVVWILVKPSMKTDA